MPGKKTRILYILHWFPALSETFILNEILELQKLDTQIDIARLNKSPDKIQHPGVSEFTGQVFEPQTSCKETISAHLFRNLFFDPLENFASEDSHSLDQDFLQDNPIGVQVEKFRLRSYPRSFRNDACNVRMDTVSPFGYPV
jgi:hypothetical protein